MIKKIIFKLLSKLQIILLKNKTYYELKNKAKYHAIYEILKNSKNKNKLIKYMEFSKSQICQDLFVLDKLNFKKKGFFVEIGAGDGEYLSNTYLLEKKFLWNGILCEPAKIFFNKIKKKRKVKFINQCVYFKNNIKILFKETKIGELSGIYNKDKILKKKSYYVNTITINNLLIENGCPQKFEYLSIDTEGGEYEILKSLNFKLFRPKIITIEHNYDFKKRENILNFLKNKNYSRSSKNISEWDDWYIDKTI